MKCAGCDLSFDTVGGVPVLVDFAASVLDRASTQKTAAASPISRRTRRRAARTHPVVANNIRKIANLVEPVARVLVIGGGEDAHGLEELTSRSDVYSITFDIYSSALTDFIADAHNIPLSADSVDCVIIQAVLEHVLSPWRVVEEIHRVLRPGGIVYAETPFMQQVHEGAYDFTRFTESGHRWLFREFEMIDSGAIGGPLLVSAWTSDFILRGLGFPLKIGIGARRVLARLSHRLDVLLNRRLNSDSASAVYFVGRKPTGDFELTRNDIISFYTRSR